MDLSKPCHFRYKPVLFFFNKEKKKQVIDVRYHQQLRSTQGIKYRQFNTKDAH